MKPRRIWLRGSLPRVEVASDLASLERDIDPKQLVVLAGAGVSVDQTSWLPTARDFLRVLYNHALPEGFPAIRLLDVDWGPRFELVLDILRTKFDPELGLLDVFRSIRPNHNHHCLARLARAGALVVTTNFDVLIELALAETGDFQCAYDAAHFAAWKLGTTAEGPPTVWHLHGVVEDPHSRERRANSIVASIRDIWVSRHLFQLDAAKGAFLVDALKHRDLFVVGYSGSDDYDITPVLTTTRSERRITWVDHQTFDPESGPPPTVEMFDFEGDAWYESPPLNLLARLVGSGARSARKTLLLKYKTSHAMQVAAGLPDESDPVSKGPLPPGVPSIYHSSIEEITRGMMEASGSAWRDAQLTECLVPWSEKFVPTRATQYLIAYMLCSACGLKHERILLLEMMRRDPIARRPTDGTSDWIAAKADFIVGTTGVPPFLPNNVIPLMPDLMETTFQGTRSEFLYSLALELFKVGHDTHRVDEAKRCALDALEAAREEPNPAVVARTSLLLARIGEVTAEGDETMNRLYEEASEAAYDAGSQELIAVARGETGLFLKTRFHALASRTLSPWAMRRSALLRWLSFGRWREHAAPERALAAEDFVLSIRALAEALRIHVAQVDEDAIKVIAANLAEILEPLSPKRGLRAHCFCLIASDRLKDAATRDEAERRTRAGASSLFPNLDLRGARGELLAKLVLERLDAEPDSQI